MSVEDDIRAWHAAIRWEDPPTARWPHHEVVELRARLIAEEAGEAVAALRNREPLEDVAKELCDLVFTAVHAAVGMGIPFDECWRRVVESNMAKVGGPVRADGKILKPAGWQPPDLRSVVYPGSERPDKHPSDARVMHGPHVLGWYEAMHDEGAHVAWGLWAEGR